MSRRRVGALLLPGLFEQALDLWQQGVSREAERQILKHVDRFLLAAVLKVLVGDLDLRLDEEDVLLGFRARRRRGERSLPRARGSRRLLVVEMDLVFLEENLLLPLVGEGHLPADN